MRLSYVLLALVPLVTSSCCTLFGIGCCEIKQPLKLQTGDKGAAITVAADLQAFTKEADVGDASLTVDFGNLADKTYQALSDKNAATYMLAQTLVCLKRDGASEDMLGSLTDALASGYLEAKDIAANGQSAKFSDPSIRVLLSHDKNGVKALAVIDTLI